MNNWPVLTRYSGRNLLRVAMPTGGIGTGDVSIGGRGDLRDWEIMNRPGKDFTPWIGCENGPFFAVAVKGADGKTQAKMLEGPLDASDCEGPGGPKNQNHGLPRFRDCSFDAAYPLAQVHLSHDGFPVSATLQAFNPLIPGDSEASGLPVVALRYILRNASQQPLTCTVCGTLPNFIGIDGEKREINIASKVMFPGECRNRNDWREEGGLRGILLSSRQPDDGAATWGTIALSTPDAGEVTKRLHWVTDGKWNRPLQDFWYDLIADGKLDERPDKEERQPIASIALTKEIAPASEAEFLFLLTWHFPNRYDWTPERHRSPNARLTRIGNYYCTKYADAWDAARKIAPQLPALERRTVEFVASFVNSDLPQVIKQAALNNLSTLRCQTCFRTPDGHFWGFEGMLPREGACYGNCTHVWNYEQATSFLFGDLARSMRTLEFAHATGLDGMMNFRINLPLEEALGFGKAAADGQMGCIMKLYRDWQLCGDDEFLRMLWPHAKRALVFCWSESGWDADRDGVMEGCQHTTRDVEYFGPNPQMTGWYLGALKAAQKMADYLKDHDFADECARLFENGSRWMDEHLFNGEFYIHLIVPPKGKVPECLYGDSGAKDFSKPDYQIGEGCLVDQLVGQYMAHICGLGYLHKPAYVKKTMASVYKYNRKETAFDHFNTMRSFTVGDEAALYMVAYPEGKQPEIPFPYYTESMSGFEHMAAAEMIYEGMEQEGLQCIADVRARFDGGKRSPFDEAECGHHYARGMASWAQVLAWTGFHYSALDQALRIGNRHGKYFWSNGHAWGTYQLEAARLLLVVIEGTLTLSRIIIGDKVYHGRWREEMIMELAIDC